MFADFSISSLLPVLDENATLINMFSIAIKFLSALLANITNGLENVLYHAVVIYALENGQYKIKDSQGKKYEIPKNRCTFMQVKPIRYLNQCPVLIFSTSR